MTTNREQLAKMTKEEMYYVYKHEMRGLNCNYGPEYVHSSYDKALEEAKRLCKKEGKRFEVLQIVSVVVPITECNVVDFRGEENECNENARNNL